MLKSLVAGLQFLTILPCGSLQPLHIRRVLPLFPICGVIIGLVLALTDHLAGCLWDRQVVAVMDLVLLTVITGALHLDGLADTADGLYGHRPIERALAIMKDSRVGAMGLVTVVCCLALKWAGFSAIEQHRFWHLLLVPGFSRATVLFGTQYLPYGRPEGGTGQAFFEQRPRWRDYSGLCALWITALLLTGWDAIWLAAGMSLITVATLSFYKKKVNCITGDMLGAMIEITETGLFLLLAAVAGASAGATV